LPRRERQARRGNAFDGARGLVAVIADATPSNRRRKATMQKIGAAGMLSITAIMG